MNHYPRIGQDQSDSTWLYCDCGWTDEQGDWWEHIEAARMVCESEGDEGHPVTESAECRFCAGNVTIAEDNR